MSVQKNSGLGYFFNNSRKVGAESWGFHHSKEEKTMHLFVEYRKGQIYIKTSYFSKNIKKIHKNHPILRRYFHKK